MQDRLGDAAWQELELLSYYMKEGLRTAQQLRQESLASYESKFNQWMNVGQVKSGVLLRCFAFDRKIL